jgi:anti-sigma regulatory factor (Ser/Thr protein kinase)
MHPAPVNLDLAEAFVSDHCHLRIGSLPEWITLTVDHLIQRATHCGAVHQSRTNRLTIALHEALTNSVIHGNLGISSELKERGDQAFAEAVASRCADPAFASRPVDVLASYDGQTARWVFTDQGAGFDVEAALNRLDNKDPDPLRPSGRGLFLMRAFVDEMHYDNGGRRVTLVLRGSGQEKRAQTRYPIAQTVRIAPIGTDGQVSWDASYDALAQDLSEKGIGFLQTHLASSARVLITIPTAVQPISLPAEVRHVQQIGGILEVGCRFETTAPATVGESAWPADPTSEALGRLVDRLARQQKPLEERRAAPRLPYTKVILVQLEGKEPVRGFGRDLSRSGIAIFTSERLPLDVVRLCLPETTEAPAISARAQVVRCARLSDDFYDVAARFLPGSVSFRSERIL